MYTDYIRPDGGDKSLIMPLPGPPGVALSLTARQRELLQLVAAGHTNIAIARRLELSPATVRKHLENTFARLDVTSRTEAAAKIRPDSAWD